jgi:predicted TPR repeat methyltransferase
MRQKPPAGPQRSLVKAFELQKAGRLEAAEAILRPMVSGVRPSPEALHLLGLVRFQRQDLAEALRLVARAVQVAPNYVDAWRNLGNLFLDSSTPDRAEECFRNVLKLAPFDIAARGNLAMLLERAERFDDAIVELQTLRRTAPTEVMALNLLAKLLRQTRRHAEEVEVARNLVHLSPHDPSLKSALSRAYFLLFDSVDQNEEQSNRVLTEWLAFDPQDPVARHMAASRSQSATPSRAADAYVARHFNEFAESYDTVLDNLDNRGPQLIENALRSLDPAPQKDRIVADLGCGTGKCSAILQPFAKRLVGVDLSEKMLDLAKVRGGYDELVCLEITAFLEKRQTAFGLILCADTLPYFGDVGPLFAALAGALQPGGVFLATAELLDGSESPFQLRKAGRYAHDPKYLQRALNDAGLTILKAEKADLRKEFGTFVQALVVTAQRPFVDVPHEPQSIGV